MLPVWCCWRVCVTFDGRLSFLEWNSVRYEFVLCIQCVVVCFIPVMFCLWEWCWPRLTCCGFKTEMREWNKIWINLKFRVWVFLKYVTKTRTDYFVFPFLSSLYFFWPLLAFFSFCLLCSLYLLSLCLLSCHQWFIFLSAHNNYIIPYPTLHYLHQYPSERPHPVPLIYHAHTQTI